MAQVKPAGFELEYFDNVWDMLARQGACDARPSRQYIRVWGEWNWQGRPTPLTRFIVAVANDRPIPSDMIGR
jgi:hypothetical protein